MSSNVLKFRYQLDEDHASPPLVGAFDPSRGFAFFIGTREQLTIWGVLTDDEFPVKPKRTRNITRPEKRVERRRGGLFEVRCWADDDRKYAAWLKRTCEKIMGGESPIAEASSFLAYAREWQFWFISQIQRGGFADRWRDFEAVHDAGESFRRAVAEAAIRAQPAYYAMRDANRKYIREICPSTMKAANWQLDEIHARSHESVVERLNDGAYYSDENANKTVTKGDIDELWLSATRKAVAEAGFEVPQNQ